MGLHRQKDALSEDRPPWRLREFKLIGGRLAVDSGESCYLGLKAVGWDVPLPWSGQCYAGLQVIGRGPPLSQRTMCSTQSLLISRLISSKHTLTEISTIMFDQTSEHCGPVILKWLRLLIYFFTVLRTGC